ncbi:MAG: DNA translocase FtsK [Muribaculum sp.]|nr:DNA translocase FtsK [Muribaculum sp.]
MASSSNRPAQRKTSSGKSVPTTRTSNVKQIEERQAEQDSALFHEIGLIALFVVMVLLFFCNFGVIGPVGNGIRDIMFGIFGFEAYVTPILIFLAASFWFANEGSPTALRKLIAGVVLFLMAGVVCELIAGTVSSMESYQIKQLYESCSQGRKGGGVLSGSLAYLLQHSLETVGTVLVVFLCSVISLILLTERSLLSGMKERAKLVREAARLRREEADEAELEAEEPYGRGERVERRGAGEDEAGSRRESGTRSRWESGRIRRDEERSRRNEERMRRSEERRLKAEEKENEKILRMERKVSGVMADTSLKKDEAKRRGDIHEITFQETEESAAQTGRMPPGESAGEDRRQDFAFDGGNVRTAHQVNLTEEWDEADEADEAPLTREAEQIRIHKEDVAEEPSSVSARVRPAAAVPAASAEQGAAPMESRPTPEAGTAAEKKVPKKYMFPPLSRLQKGKASAGDSIRELKETAMRLQQTLGTFGVKVTVTDISQGPSVTRYELQPEQGVKVSKIVGLSDDIKLNLAATDIRIEAPIPGKAAVGIEVPNKENMTVALRDLFESREFQEFPSNIAFAVGKDIAGKTVVADIAKMPHMLIAGATGSGKSVCINTLIMSILYKAHPDDVKLIMVDPKVVELSVYNGIPHLLIPVVTDPKKASAALHWAVSEMEDRYRKFADYNVRDLKGYNQKLETMREKGGEDVPDKLPQIVIIVDELADLMMVCPGEVEESICRLAQLARACGIHLIIATQRPSVDVITGLIKANMPSRVAFAVSSGVDSRTILDMVGAEKLLGKGDMLFYPQGYSKPARIQGAFVSDKEVSDVVDFLRNQALGNTYAEDVEEKIAHIDSGSGAGSAGVSGGNDRDEYFAEAGRFVIDKDKASIGMLQRVLKIGFNRAARIMDQLCEYGVVGEEEGTKPRKVLMSPEQFEQLLEEI